MAVPLAPARAILEMIDGSRRLQQVHGGEKDREQDQDRHQLACPRGRSPAAVRPSTAMAPRKTGFMRLRPSATITKGTMPGEGDQQHRQIDLPVVRGVHAGLDDGRRDDQEHAGHHQVQREDAEIQSQQLAVAQHPAELVGDGLRVPVDGPARPGSAPPATGPGCRRRPGAAVSQKTPAEPPDLGDGRPQDQGQAEGDADARTRPRPWPGCAPRPGSGRRRAP